MISALIVDDSAFMRGIIRCILEQEGYAVVAEAGNGMDCVAKYVRLRPQLVTLDITMHGMNGLDTLKALHQIDPQVKVIMVSALGQTQILKDAITYGAKSFIVKPFSHDHFVTVLRSLE